MGSDAERESMFTTSEQGPSAVDATGLWYPKGLVAVIDTSTFVAARVSKGDRPTSSREVIRLSGTLYDSFTSPTIIEEVERVLARPKFGFAVEETRYWLDTFVRHNRQVYPLLVPGDYSAALGNDEKDNHVLQTALAVNLYEEGQRAIAEAQQGHGCFIVSWDRDFEPGRNVCGWRFIRPGAFLDLLLSVA